MRTTTHRRASSARVWRSVPALCRGVRPKRDIGQEITSRVGNLDWLFYTDQYKTDLFRHLFACWVHCDHALVRRYTDKTLQIGIGTFIMLPLALATTWLDWQSKSEAGQLCSVTLIKIQQKRYEKQRV